MFNICKCTVHLQRICDAPVHSLLLVLSVYARLKKKEKKLHEFSLDRQMGQGAQHTLNVHKNGDNTDFKNMFRACRTYKGTLLRITESGCTILPRPKQKFNIFVFFT
jgi:hypothetical protein